MAVTRAEEQALVNCAVKRALYLTAQGPRLQALIDQYQTRMDEFATELASLDAIPVVKALKEQHLAGTVATQLPALP